MSSLDSLFKNIQAAEPDKALETRILRAIMLERDARARRRLFAARAGLAGSFTAFVSAGFAYGEALLESDFWNLLPLLFSDVTIIAQHWSSFLFSLLETFPAFALAAFLVPIFILLISLRFSVPGTNGHRYDRLAF